MEIKELTKKLCSLMSVSGHENFCRAEIDDIVRDAGFESVTEDSVGNRVFVKKCGRDSAPAILIDTHFDEIGMMVTRINENGFLNITAIGGLDPSVMQASRVVIYGNGKTIHGVVASTPPHLKKENDRKKLKDIDALLIDTGYSKEELEKFVRVGTPVGFEPVYTELISGRIAGKSFDNKACCAAAVSALANTTPCELAGDVYLLFSSYEETLPTGGAAVGAFGISPDYAMVIDVNLAKMPDVPETETVAMGKGVSITLSSSTDRRLTRMVMDMCDGDEIKYQKIASPSSTGTNAVSVNLSGRGVPVVDVGIPLECMHTYNEIISLDDLRDLSCLVRGFVCSTRIAQTFGGAAE